MQFKIIFKNLKNKHHDYNNDINEYVYMHYKNCSKSMEYHFLR